MPSAWGRCGIARAAGVPLVVAAKMQDPAEHEYFDAEVQPLLERMTQDHEGVYSRLLAEARSAAPAAS